MTAAGAACPTASPTPAGSSEVATATVPANGRILAALSPAPRPAPPTCWPNAAPVMSYTRAYNGHDSEVTDALEEYYLLRMTLDSGVAEL